MTASSAHECFYRIRWNFFHNDPTEWRALIGPCPQFVEILRRHASEVTLAIATAKDRDYVTRLLTDYAIDDLFADEVVLDKDTGVSKTAHLQHLHHHLNLNYTQMSFMDDKVNHLDAVAPLGVRCALATWATTVTGNTGSPSCEDIWCVPWMILSSSCSNALPW